MKKTIIAALTVLSLAGCQQSSAPQPAVTSAPVPAENGEMTGALQADVQLKKNTFYPGEQIDVMAVGTGISDTAWVGIVPASVPHGEEKTNDENDLGYVYLKDNSRIILIAPKEPGKYDVRLNDNDENGKEIAHAEFMLAADPEPVTEGKLMWDPAKSVPAGAEFEVPFQAPLEFESNAWVGIVPADTAHGEEKVGDAANKGYEHISGRSRGAVMLKAPAEAGTYDVRMYDSDSEGKEITSVSIEVTAE